MGRKAKLKIRKQKNQKVYNWLEVLLLEIQDKNLERLTIDDIAKLAGKSKSTIYTYFDSKEEILSAAIEARINKLQIQIEALGLQSLATHERYISLIELFAQASSGIGIPFLQSIKKNFPTSFKLIEAFIRFYLDLLKQQYQQGIQEKIYRENSVELLIQLDKSFVLQILTDFNFYQDKKITLSELIRDYLKIRLYGIMY